MNPLTIAQIGATVGPALWDMFKPNPANQGMKHLEQIPQYGREAYNPFIQRGQQAENELFPMYQQLAQNPQAFYNQAMQGYKPSAGYQYKLGQLQNAAHNTAASGGYLGTDYDVNRRNEAIHGLLGTDMNEYLQNIFGLQGAGMQGLEQRTGRGFQSAGNLADYLGTAALNQAQYRGAGTQYGNQGMTNGLASLAKFIQGFEGAAPATASVPLKSGVPGWGQSQMAANPLIYGGR